MLRPLIPILAVQLVVGTSHAACPSAPSDLRDAVNAANAAFSAMEQASFEKARDEARLAVTCLSEPITPVDAAALHRLEAFDAFLRQDTGRTLEAFRASLALQPSFTLPDTVAPDGSPLDQQYDAARAMADARFTALAGQVGALLLVDGALSWARPESRPAILQVLSMDGRVTWSGYLWPESPLPSGLSPSTSVDDSTNLVRRPFASPHPPLTRDLTYGSLGAATVAASLLALAWSYRADYADTLGNCLAGGCGGNPEGAAQELEDIRRRMNASSIASGGVGLVSVGLGTMALVSLRW